MAKLLLYPAEISYFEVKVRVKWLDIAVNSPGLTDWVLKKSFLSFFTISLEKSRQAFRKAYRVSHANVGFLNKKCPAVVALKWC